MVGTKDQEFLKFGKWGAHGTLGGASSAENSKGGVKIKSLPGGGGLRALKELWEVTELDAKV